MSSTPSEHSNPTRGNAGRGGSRNRRRYRGHPRNLTTQETPIPDTNNQNDIPPIPGGNIPTQLIPSSIQPQATRMPQVPETETRDANHPSNRGTRQRGGRGRNRGRGGGYNGYQQTQPAPQDGPSRGRDARIVGGRQFGGQLTGGDTQEPRSPSVQADAPEFIPGQRYVSRSGPAGVSKAVPVVRRNSITSSRRRNSIAKSTAADLPTRIHEDISNGAYECAICTMDLHRKSKIWSCKTCWTAFHLHCVKAWAKNSQDTARQRQTQAQNLDALLNWRCPGCNLPKEDMPSSYSCWCEKEIDPRPELGLPPHSCGQSCGKIRVVPKSCPHPCDLICHAGPCPPCSHMGPTQSCFCGKHQTIRRCAETNYDVGAWSCGEICGDMMPCGEHSCPKPCHEGLCGACEELVDVRCYCGKVQTSMMCSAKDDEMDSQQIVAKDKENEADVVETWTGVFDCRQMCEKFLDCGKHHCEKGCHPQDSALAHCPRSPDVVTYCPCGKSLLEELSDGNRITCEDPIPNCDKVCLKSLPCGHQCEAICHSGDCLPCTKTVLINCRCGRNTFSTICHQGVEEAPQCLRICKVTINCGRHECGERCCPGERQAVERQALKRKPKPLTNNRPAQEEFEPEHICTRVCERPLKCGNHTCPELCHKGPCSSCREATFEDIYCNCGRTCTEAPVACGTQPPACDYDCERVKACGHPQVPHKCHGDPKDCPKCPYLVEKECMCGKKTLKNQPCWHLESRCGAICGKKLKCGSHYCQKQCHRPGQCEDATTRCQQPCGKPKKSCGHPCEAPCHAPYPCQESQTCPFKLLITCDCQNLKAEVKCNASKSSEGNSKRTLKCDDECARLERNRKLALALNIDPATHQDDHIPYQQEVLNHYKSDPDWSLSHESALRIFAADKGQKRYNFKPMKPHQRAFIHGLAEDFGFDTESMDPEPYRHVAVFKTPRFVASPLKTLAQCVRIMNARLTDVNTKAAETHRALSAARSAPLNGFYIHGARFGLTEDDLRAAITSSLTDPTLTILISFLPHDEIALRASHYRLNPKELETHLRTLKPALSTTLLLTNRIAESIQLCAFDPNSAVPNVLRQESDTASGASGWSQVAAKAASAAKSAPVMEPLGKKTAYTVLGSRVAEAKKKRRSEEEEAERKAREGEGEVEGEVVDDWMVAAERMSSRE